MGLLSWLRGGRGSDAGAPDARGAAGGGTQSPPSSTSPPASPAVPGWRELPPLQRSLGSPPGLVSDPAAFRGSLSAWQDTSFHTPLGHLVSPEAPSGLGHGLTSAFTVSRETEVSDEGTGRSASAGTAGPGTGTRAGTGAAAVPLQRAPDERSLLSARPLRTSPGELPQLDVAAPAPAASPSEAGSGPVTEPRPAPVQRTSAPEVQGEHRSAPASGPYRFGLGEPLHGLPPTAQRSVPADAGSPQLPEFDSPSVTASSDSGDTVVGGQLPVSREEVDAPTTPEPAADSRPLLGDDPLTPLTGADDAGQEKPPADEVPASAPAGSAAPPDVKAAVPLQRATVDGTPLPPRPAPAPQSVAPLVAQRSVPLFSGAEASAVSAPGGDESTAPAVPVRWTDASGPVPEARTETAGDGAGGNFPVGGHSSQDAVPHVQRTAGAGGRPSSSSRSPAVPVTAPAAPVQRAVPGGDLTTAPSRPASRTSLLDAGAVAVASGVAQRMADGSVVFGTPAVQRDTGPDPQDPPPDSSGDTPPPDEPVDPPPEPEAGPPDPGPEPSGEEGADGGGSGGSSARGRTPAVTDELVRALFTPLSRMLKAELRLDRERAGFLIDTRH